MNIEEARAYLKTVMSDKFTDRTFENYIDGTLAGDFAVEIATTIKGLDAEEGRGLVCVFCGEGFGYAGKSPDEATLKAATEHEKECPRNPYKAEILRLQEENKTLNGINKIIAAGQNESHPGPWVQRAFDALAVAISLTGIIKEADDYLNTNTLTNIAHGSIMHQKFKEALAEAKSAESV